MPIQNKIVSACLCNRQCQSFLDPLQAFAPISRFHQCRLLWTEYRQQRRCPHLQRRVMQGGNPRDRTGLDDTATMKREIASGMAAETAALGTGPGRPGTIDTAQACPEGNLAAEVHRGADALGVGLAVVAVAEVGAEVGAGVGDGIENGTAATVVAAAQFVDVFRLGSAHIETSKRAGARADHRASAVATAKIAAMG